MSDPAVQLVDTPPQPESPPKGFWAEVRATVGDLARPIALISVGIGSLVAIITIAQKVDNGNDGAIFIGAVLAGLGALYVGKVWENNTTTKANAEVAKAQAAAGAGQ